MAALPLCVSRRLSFASGVSSDCSIICFRSSICLRIKQTTHSAEMRREQQ